MRATWTDSRLDDFAAHTDQRFDDLGRRMDAGFARVDQEFRKVRGEIGALQRTIIQVGGAIAAGVVALIAAVLALVATQL